MLLLFPFDHLHHLARCAQVTTTDFESDYEFQVLICQGRRTPCLPFRLFLGTCVTRKCTIKNGRNDPGALHFPSFFGDDALV